MHVCVGEAAASIQELTTLPKRNVTLNLPVWHSICGGQWAAPLQLLLPLNTWTLFRKQSHLYKSRPMHLPWTVQLVGTVWCSLWGGGSGELLYRCGCSLNNVHAFVGQEHPKRSHLTTSQKRKGRNYVVKHAIVLWNGYNMFNVSFWLVNVFWKGIAGDFIYFGDTRDGGIKECC